MTTEDDALLKRELYWRPKPGDRRRPAGSNAITAIGIVLTLVQWAITGLVFSRVMAGPSTTSGMIDPRSIVALAIFGAEMFVAGILATRIWVNIGPAARNVLRPFGVLGPWPMLIIAAFIALVIASFIAAPFLPKPVTSGRNWQLLTTTPPEGVPLEEAVQLCEQTGARVPSLDDLKAFDPPFPQGTAVWLEQNDAQEGMLFLSAEARPTRRVTRSSELVRYAAVCFRP